jgi:hypothetical protein
MYESGSTISLFPIPCAKNTTCLALETLMWVDAPCASTSYYDMPKKHVLNDDIEVEKIATTKAKCKKIKQNNEEKHCR